MVYIYDFFAHANLNSCSSRGKNATERAQQKPTNLKYKILNRILVET